MNKITSNEETSFWNLILNTSKIEIPIIQRDYAQGRDNEKTKAIRDKFLSDIIEVLGYSDSKKNNNSVKVPLELDFVYGNVEKNIFQPLDGQQRLTTLFLLHWYIALKTDNLSNTKSIFLKFTYETRISSREFCNELVINGESLGRGEAISEKISDSKWFFLSWKKDPTIKAMLLMLDCIDERLQNISKDDLKQYWQKLTSPNPPIIFIFKELNDIGLTDDLYIKMNARGKALTDFENFKARFEKHIEKNKWETNEVELKNSYSYKIDTIWTDLFWKHRGTDNLIDNEFLKFVAGVAINSYAQYHMINPDADDEQYIRKFLEGKTKGKISEESIKRERIERRITLLFNYPALVSPTDFPTLVTFIYLKNCFDIYSKNQNDELLPSNLPLWDFLEKKNVKINSDTEIDNNLFIEFVKDGRTEYKQRVLFYAQTQYLLNSEKNNNNSFSEWMRVVRNIVQNSTIDSASTFMGAIGLINELTRGCQNIYDYLHKNNVLSGFASTQISEEVLKSSIIGKKIDNKTIIFSTEDTDFFKGKISFALFCIGFESEESSFDVDLLNSIFKIVCEHLCSYDISNKFRSAFLTIKNNDFYNYWGTWSYGTDSYKRCLIENTNDLKSFFLNDYYKDYLKDLLLMLVNKSLTEIINDYECPHEMPNWKRRLIKEPQLLDNYCQAHFFGIPNDNKCCFLYYYKKRPSSRDECKIIE